MSRRMATAVTVMLAVGLGAGACGPSDGSGTPAGAATGTSAASSISAAQSSPAATHDASPAVTTVPLGSSAPASPTAPAAADPRTLASATPTPRPAAADDCRTAYLRFTLTRLDGPAAGADGSAAARLTAQNTGTTPCVFDGYPRFRVHVGKGPEVTAQPSRDPAPRLTLAPGRTAVIDLHYSQVPDTSGVCYLPAASRAQAQALPPHAAPTETGVAVPMTDSHGRVVPTVVCSQDIWMGAPALG